MQLTYNIPLAAMTKKNHHRIVTVTDKRTGRKKQVLIPSEQYIRFRKDCGWFIKPVTDNPIDSPVNVKYLFYMNTMRIVDLLNLCEGMDDILVDYGVLKDDNCKIVVSHDGSRVYYDKENPRIEIEITDTEATFIKTETSKNVKKTKKLKKA